VELDRLADRWGFSVNLLCSMALLLAVIWLNAYHRSKKGKMQKRLEEVVLVL